MQGLDIRNFSIVSLAALRDDASKRRSLLGRRSLKVRSRESLHYAVNP